MMKRAGYFSVLEVMFLLNKDLIKSYRLKQLWKMTFLIKFRQIYKVLSTKTPRQNMQGLVMKIAVWLRHVCNKAL